MMFFAKSYDVVGTPLSDNCSHHVNHVNAIDFVPAWHKDLARYVDLYIYTYIYIACKVTPKHLSQLLFHLEGTKMPAIFLDYLQHLSASLEVFRYVGAICTTCCWLTRRSWRMNLPRVVLSRSGVVGTMLSGSKKVVSSILGSHGWQRWPHQPLFFCWDFVEFGFSNKKKPD